MCEKRIKYKFFPKIRLNDFVEISLKKSKTTIEVKAKNDSGVTTIKKSEIKKPILKKSFLKQLWIWIQRVFKL